jgi:predicted dinucleotide-binding enzyme
VYKVAALGSGVVGRTLAQGFLRHGYDVRIASGNPAKLADFQKSSGVQAVTFADAARWADIVVLAVKGSAALDVIAAAGEENLRGKTVIDTTNPIAALPPVDGVVQFFTGPNSSLMEQLQAAQPATNFVKAFNSVGNARMVNPSFADGKPTMFYCGNDARAREQVAEILLKFGWEPADMGKAAAARAIEPLCQLWCIPGFLQGTWSHAFKVLWK